MGLAGWWRFEETSGTTVYDSSPHGNHGVISGSLSRPDGIIGKALTNNAAGMITVPDSDNLDFGTSSFSISLWVKYPLGANNPYWML